MSALFVCDNIFLTKNDKVYSNTFSYSMLKRYISVFSKVTVLARKSEVERTPDMLLSSGEGVSFVFLESISTLGSFFGLRQRHKKTIEKLAMDHDAVIVRLPGEFGLLAASVARKINKKCLIEVVGCAWDVMWNYGGFTSKIYAPYFFLKTKNSIRKSNVTIYVTKSFLQGRYPSSKDAVTINIADVELADTDEKIVLQRVQKIESMNEKILFGTMGFLSVEYKGIGVALQILGRLADMHPNFEYHILGEGDPAKYKAAAKRLGVAEKVFFDSALPGGRAVFDWLDGIDIYLQPSIAEGLSRALLEAMSRGCPAVGSSVGGIPELLDEDMIFDHNDIQRFLEIIESLIRDKSLMVEVSKDNFNKAKKYQKNILDQKRSRFLIAFRDGLSNPLSNTF